MQNLVSFSRKPIIYNSIAASFATTTASKPKGRFSLFSRAPPLPNLKPYYDLRVYRNASWGALFSTYFVNMLSRRKLLGVQAARTHEIFGKYLGKGIANQVFFKTFGSAHISGETLNAVRKDLVEYNDKNISVTITYRGRQLPENGFSEYELEENATKYIQTIGLLGKNSYQDNSLSINLTNLANLGALLKVNKAQGWLQSIFESYPGTTRERIYANIIFEKLKQRYVECDEAEFAEFLGQVLGREINSDLSREEITRFEWLQNVHAFYVDSPEKNSNKILRQLNRLTDEEAHRMEGFCDRLREIFDTAQANHLYGVINEVEDVQLQPVNDSITQQFSLTYNKNNILLLNALQAGVKDLKNKLQFEAERCVYLKMPLGVKLLNRGLSSEASPDAFDEGVQLLLEKFISGSKVIIASDNVESLEKAKQIIDKKNIDPKKSGLRLGQRRGVAGYDTYRLLREGYRVNEEIFFGKRDEVMPWLIQRVQEKSSDPTLARIENRLIRNEIARRIRLT